MEYKLTVVVVVAQTLLLLVLGAVLLGEVLPPPLCLDIHHREHMGEQGLIPQVLGPVVAVAEQVHGE